jgi:hypothetical protein
MSDSLIWFPTLIYTPTILRDPGSVAEVDNCDSRGNPYESEVRCPNDLHGLNRCRIGYFNRSVGPQARPKSIGTIPGHKHRYSQRGGIERRHVSGGVDLSSARRSAPRTSNRFLPKRSLPVVQRGAHLAQGIGAPSGPRYEL